MLAAHTEGLIAASFTPMHDDGTVNLDAVGPLADLLHRNGVRGAFVCGSTGEGVSLTVEERKALAAQWVAVAPEGFRVIVHVGHTSVPTCRELASHAESVGAHATAAMPPFYFRPSTVEELASFCAEVAAAQAIPFYYYHIPALTGVTVPVAELLERAANCIPNLAGVKFTSPDLADYALARAACNERFDMLYGVDEMLLAALAVGARGAVGSTYNFAAPLYTRIAGAFDTGDLETARALQTKSAQLVRILRAAARSFLSAAKAVMGMVGVECGQVRTPLPPISGEERKALQQTLETVGFEAYCCK